MRSRQIDTENIGSNAWGAETKKRSTSYEYQIQAAVPNSLGIRAGVHCLWWRRSRASYSYCNDGTYSSARIYFNAANSYFRRNQHSSNSILTHFDS